MKAYRIKGHSELNEEEISYWQVSDGTWLLNLPGVGIGSLAKHTVEEHEDGTISVTPSIIIKSHLGQRHGYLTKGEWTE